MRAFFRFDTGFRFDTVQMPFYVSQLGKSDSFFAPPASSDSPTYSAATKEQQSGGDQIDHYVDGPAEGNNC